MLFLESAINCGQLKVRTLVYGRRLSCATVYEIRSHCKLSISLRIVIYRTVGALAEWTWFGFKEGTHTAVKCLKEFGASTAITANTMYDNWQRPRPGFMVSVIGYFWKCNTKRFIFHRWSYKIGKIDMKHDMLKYYHNIECTIWVELHTRNNSKVNNYSNAIKSSNTTLKPTIWLEIQVDVYMHASPIWASDLCKLLITSEYMRASKRT